MAGPLIVPVIALAHGVPALGSRSEPAAGLALGLALAVACTAYLLTWRRTTRVHRREAAFFLAGCVALAAALLWPLESLGEHSLAWHMVQHLLLMTVAAPLLILGLPMRLLLAPVVLRTSVRRRRSLSRGLRRCGDARWLGPGMTGLLVFWHLPVAVSAALASDTVHLLMHGSLLAVALPFWGAVLRAGSGQGASLAGAALLLFSTMGVMTLMGALLTLAARPLYPAYPLLEDQQLAGLIMWIPGALPFLAAGIWLGHRWVARGQ